MTYRERLELCGRLIAGYQAERVGLVQAKIGRPLTRGHFADDYTWERCQVGYTEGRAILETEEGT